LKIQSVSNNHKFKLKPLHFGNNVTSAVINPLRLQKAQIYLQETQVRLGSTRRLGLFHFDLKLLEGIQDGLDVFKDVSMRQIEFLSQNLRSVLIDRGCRNQCTHCYVSAAPPPHSTQKEMISTVAWEDLLSLTEGVKELKKRLNFDFIEPNPYFNYLTPFKDSDPVNFRCVDNQGNAHDITDATKILHDAFQMPVLFDTTGWAKNDTRSKLAAQKFANYALENPDSVYGINVSINPFHGIMSRSIELAKQGQRKAAVALREIYIERIAETLLTFYKTHQKRPITIIGVYAPKGEKNLGYTEKELQALFDEILNRVRSKAENYPHEDKDLILKMYLNLKREDSKFNQIGAAGRGKRFFSPEIEYIESETPKGNKTIDINGRVFVTNWHNESQHHSTNIQLNYANKNKQTVPLNVTHQLNIPE